MTDPVSPNYCTIEDLEAAGVSQDIIDGLGGDPSVKTATLLGMLNKRSRYADGYIARAFTLPLIQWGDDLRLAVSQLTAWDVMTVLVGINPETPAGDIWKQRRLEAQAWLEGVALKRIVPPEIIDSESPDTDDGIGVSSDASRGWNFPR